MDKSSGKLVQRSLAEGLDLPREGYTVFKDYVNGLEYIRACGDITNKGLFALLGGYQCQVFLDWRFVDGKEWQTVHDLLNGAGVPSMQAKYEELFAPKAEIVPVELLKKKQAQKKTLARKSITKTAARKPAVKKKNPASPKK
jgi:hypothetical protein